MKKILSYLLYGLVITYGCRCTSSTENDVVVKVIIDTDMGSDCDDVGALALLHRYADTGKAEIIACIYSSGKVPYGAGVIDAINIYYGRPGIPIGAEHDSLFGDPVDKMLAEELATDTSRFGHSIIRNSDVEEQTRLNRMILNEQENNSIDYITIGHTKGLYDLLISKPDEISPLTGYDLVRKKIRRWVALGALGANNKEGHYVKDWNFCFNGSAEYTEYLIEKFPRPVYFVNAGTDILTGRSLKNTPPGNIVRTAYENWLWNYEQKTLDDQRPSWDLVTVYFAVEGLGDYLQEADIGWLEFDVHQGSLWKNGKNSLDHHYIIQKENVSDRFAVYLNHMISFPPMHTIK